MTFLSKDRTNGGLNSSGQCKKIVNAVKCLMAKGYENIGLTYSANQAQTTTIWGKYNYDVTKPYSISNNNFDNGKPKTIAETEISGDNQAEVLGPYYIKEQNKTTGKWEPVGNELPPLIDTLTDKDESFRKAFRIIPFTTMQKGGGDLDTKNPGNNNDCIKAADDFLKLPNSIILGWCNQDCGNMNDTSDPNQKFAIGGGVAAGLKEATNTYIPQYLQFLKKNWSEDVQKIVNTCSPSPTSVDSPASSPATPPLATTTPKVPIADVLTTLEGKLTQDSENDAEIKKLVTTLHTDFLYPPSESDGNKKKNLNSAEPAIEDMIKEFEAADGGETNFYLGACRSIQAAYKLDETEADVDDNKKIRAKLLLNLRKNSLLLKVPRRWDYATMTLEKVEAPPTELNALMDYSLQDTIEYYSQEGGDEGNRFKDLNIAENPRDANVDSDSIPGIDGRFVMGINAKMNQACFFVSALQLLFCDEDFLQLIIFISCQADDYITNISSISSGECNNKSISNLENITSVTYDKTQPIPTETTNVGRGKIFLNDLVKLFKAYTEKKEVTEEIMKSLYDTLALRYAKQQDSSEVITRTIAYLECLDNPYVKKFLNNCFLKITKTITTKTHVDFDAQDEPEKQLTDKLIVIKPPLSNIVSSSSVQDLFNSYLGEEPEDFEFSKNKIKNASTRKKLFDILSVDGKSKCILCKEFLEFLNANPETTSIFQGYDTKSINYVTSGSRKQSELKITLDAIKGAIAANTGSDEQTCRIIVEDIKYVILNPMVKESGSSTYTNLKKTSKKNVDKYSEYIFIHINRGLEGGAKNLIQIDISKTLDISNSKYTLVGYVFHSGSSSSGGHFVCVKCDSDGEPKVEISDTSVKKWTDKYASNIEWGTGVFLLIYKQKEGIQAGGGFKPRHNATATHTISTPKSKHNSSFKVSSSKYKHKGHNRSHTQRVK
jgi:hypothetical protein